MKSRYYLFRAKIWGLAVIGAALCICIGAAGGGIKASRVSAGREKRPIYSVETDKPEVSLGINCAWGNEDIPELIEILERYKISATFFIVGDWCDKYPESVKSLYDAGHEIGSHSDTHSDMTKLDDAGILREIRDSAEKLSNITGAPVRLFRVPSGAYNSNVISLIEQEGMYPIQWDCDSIDYKNPEPDVMLKRVLKKMRSGSIMLFHSGAKNTPSALPLVIEAAEAKGYRFVQVGKLIHPTPYSVDFEGRQILAKE